MDSGGRSINLIKGGVIIKHLELTNSTKNFMPLLVYQGSESYDVVKQGCDEVFKKLEKWKQVNVALDEVPDIRLVILHLAADLKSQKTIMSHKGYTAAYPCTMCIFPKKTPCKNIHKCFDYRNDENYCTPQTKKLSIQDSKLLNVEINNCHLPFLHILWVLDTSSPEYDSSVDEEDYVDTVVEQVDGKENIWLLNRNILCAVRRIPDIAKNATSQPKKVDYAFV
uniref:Ribonuclease H-like domain-containing protein n=1 Tax=Parastrongyloides trichosuri TaxID=131310 RepID=A0A0N4ZZQ2_PARTI